MWSNESKLAVLHSHLLNDNFNYYPDNTLRHWPEGKQNPSVKLMREGPEMREEVYQKSLIFDLDGVVNKPKTPSPIELYVDHVTGENEYLKQNRDNIIRNIKMLEKEENFVPYANSISDYFRKGELNFGMHIDACNYVRDNLSIATNFTSALSRLRDMGYNPFILSASPKELIEKSKDRLMINPDDVEATEFQFDANGFFQGMKLNLGNARSEKRDRILEKTVLTKYGLEIMVDDNPDTGKRIVKSGWNHIYFWLKESPPLSENINIDMPDLRQDFTKLVKKLKRLEKGLAVTILMDEASYRDTIELAHNIMERGERAMVTSGLEFYENKQKFIKNLRNYVNNMKGLFPSKQTNLSVYIKDLELDKNENTAKPKLKSLMKLFYKNSLETKLSENTFTIA